MTKRPLEPDPDHTGVGKRSGQQRAFPLIRASAVATSLGAFLFFGEKYNDSGSLSDYTTRV